jgi:hypothetical protein
MTETSEATMSTLQQDDCANCGVPLSGKFCHECGQSSRSMIKFFGEVLKELLDDILGYDSRLKHSILPLLFKPGKLTLEYIHGRRFYYVMPFRLYLITSILFIFIVQLNLDTEHIIPNDVNSQEISTEDKQELKQDVQEIMDEIGDSISEIQKQQLLKSVDDLKEPTEEATLPALAIEKPINQEANKEEKKNKKNVLGFTFIDGKLVHQPWIVEEEGPMKVFADEINSKIPNWIEKPKPLLDELFRIAPYMMLFLIPIFALFQKLFYAFSKRFYVEHLIFSLHNHSFLYLALLASLATESSANYLVSIEGFFAQSGYYIANTLDGLIGIWIVVYIFIATKKVYQQAWLLTIFKTLGLGLIYFILSMLGMVSIILIGAYTA